MRVLRCDGGVGWFALPNNIKVSRRTKKTHTSRIYKHCLPFVAQSFVFVDLKWPKKFFVWQSKNVIPLRFIYFVETTKCAYKRF